MFEWFIEPLKKSIIENSISILIQIVIVDGFLYDCAKKESRSEYFSRKIGNIDYIHVSPKPTKWQGEYRKTQDNYFAAANTRNTGACYAKYDYIAFIDDLGIISPSWLVAVIKALEKNEIHCGAYTKVKNIEYDTISCSYNGGDENDGRDHRLDIYKDKITQCPGGHLYGSSFSLPKNDYFEINGQNEMCDGLGGEDYDLGMRLERSGKKIYYNKMMFIHESNSSFDSDKERKCIRKDPVVDEGKYVKILKEYNISDIYNGRRDLSHFMLSYGNCGPVKVNPEFSLANYNKSILEGNSNIFLLPICNEIHFFTKKCISHNDFLT